MLSTIMVANNPEIFEMKNILAAVKVLFRLVSVSSINPHVLTEAYKAFGQFIPAL